jgi:hypothetical protein
MVEKSGGSLFSSQRKKTMDFEKQLEKRGKDDSEIQ